jgi:hypothetical protein
MLELFFSKNLDKWQLITKAGEGGDTCSRHFTALYCLDGTTAEIRNALELLQKDGIPVRHPDPDRWYSTTDRTSRDQLIPYLAFVSRKNYTSPVKVRNAFKALVAQHAKRAFLFAWNTRRNWVYANEAEHLTKSTPDVRWNYAWKLPDICFMNVWAMYVRGFIAHFKFGRAISPLLWPMLCIMDTYALASVLLIYAQLAIGWKIGPTRLPRAVDHDMQNLTLSVHHAATNCSTPVAWLTWALFRPWANEAATSFYTQPEEPRLDLVIRLLK